MNSIELFCFSSFLLAGLFVGALKIVLKKHLLDIPNERSSHMNPTPRGGGIGFIISYFIVLSLIIGFNFRPEDDINFFHWIALIPLIIVGFIDDRYGLTARTRYLVQLFTSTIIVLQGRNILASLDLSSISVGYFFTFFITVIGVTAIINFYNFMDGLDGLLAGVSIVQLGYLAMCTHSSELWILVSAVCGFLFWNWQPAKIFMGDAGSTFLGAAMAVAILNEDAIPSQMQMWSLLSITLPITLDTTYTIICRLIRRENIFQAHRTHLFQRLHQVGWSHAKVSTLYIGGTLLTTLVLSMFGSRGIWINVSAAALCLICCELYLRKDSKAYTTSK